jgi:glycosyltransferase involved in cell wall biosynthesis
MTTYLFDASSYNSEGRPFGVSRYAYALARAFGQIAGELDVDERILASYHLSGPAAVTADLRIERYVDAVPTRYKAYNRRRRRFGRTLQQAGADLVHFVEGPQMIPVRDLAAVVTCHDLIPILDPEHYLRGRYARFKRRLRDYWSYWSARRVIAISQATADVLGDLLRLPAERITVIPQGVDHERFHPRAAAAEHDDIRDGHRLPERYALYVGATDWRKRVDMLIAAHQGVFRATGVPLALVGAEFSRPKNSATIQAMREASPGSIVVVGEVTPERLPALYRQADLHVLPSIYEGFGLTILEAMACGCPVIATTGGAVPEVAGDAAELVRPDHAADLEAAAIALLRDDSARERLRLRGLERASRFTWERTARETLALYRRATGRAVARAAGGIGEDAARQHRQQP